MSTNPILTTTRVSDKPVRWRTFFYACGTHLEGSYTLEIVGYGKTPELARASAATNLDRVKARLLVASIEFGSHRVQSITENAEG